MKPLLRACRWLLPLTFLAACAGELNTPGEALRLLGGSLEDAYLGEHYESAFRPAGGLRPYDYELGAGQLPPGISLEGGTLRGVPQELGTFTFTINLTDANLSSTFLEHRLRVVELPDPEVVITMPETEVRAPFTVRVEVTEARELHGFSSRLRWDPARFTYVPGSLSPSSDSYALFSATGQDWLQVDVAWLGSSFTGERQVFTFQLEPHEPFRPGLAISSQFALGSDAGGSYQQSNVGTRVPPLAREQPQETMPQETTQEETMPEETMPADEGEAATEPDQEDASGSATEPVPEDAAPSGPEPEEGE